MRLSSASTSTNSFADEYGDARHIHAATEVDPNHAGAEYSYDDNGNMLTRHENGILYTQTWTQGNRLASVSWAMGEETHAVTFVYDGDGTRVKRIVSQGGSEVSRTVYIGGLYEVEIAGANPAVITRYYALVGQAVALRKDGVLSYLLSDHLGSNGMTASPEGIVTGVARYLPYGQPRVLEGSESLPVDKTFTGQRAEAFGLMDYNARFYDPYLNRFLSPDSIVPNTGEGNNPNAVGYVANANYSALVVDYHENQFLEQLNQENRIRLEDPNVRLPGVPTNPLAFDRYAYCFNNPVRYNDPSGHCPACAVAVLGDVGFTISAPVLIIGGLVVVAGVVAYDTFAPGREQRHQEISTGLSSFATQTTNGINVLLHKRDWIPPNLNPDRRNDFQKAAEKYKEAYSAGSGFQLPKELAKKLADLLNSGKSVRDAVDAMPELDEYLEGEDESD